VLRRPESFTVNGHWKLSKSRERFSTLTFAGQTFFVHTIRLPPPYPACARHYTAPTPFAFTTLSYTAHSKNYYRTNAIIVKSGISLAYGIRNPVERDERETRSYLTEHFGSYYLVR